MEFLSSFLRDPLISLDLLVGLKLQEPHIGGLEAYWNREPITSILTELVRQAVSGFYMSE